MPHVSAESKAAADAWSPAEDDVIVNTFPKSGTTLAQNLCEQLRTNAGGYGDFEEITERQPWIAFALDCGQDLDGEQCARPRLFKEHQLFSAVNAGCRYITTIRDPARVLASWHAFQKAKGRAPYAGQTDANQLVRETPEVFAAAGIFGTNVWEFYREVYALRRDPRVLVLCYEELAGPEQPRCIAAAARFLGLPDDAARDAAVAKLLSREVMLQHVHRFDDHFIAERQRAVGTACRIMEPSAKVTPGRHSELNAHTRAWLEAQWQEQVCASTGLASYAELVAAVRQ